MQTQRLYYSDTDKLHHTTSVTSIDGNTVQLDSTIFHPQGGGQPSDIGTINGIQVIKIIDSSNGEIQHILEKTPNFKIGDTVTLLVDEASRKLFSRLHSAGHLIAYVAEGEFPALKAIQGHHFPNEARVEFIYDEVPDLTNFQDQLVQALQNAISKNEHITSNFDDSVRKVTFGTSTATPCGGTHVRFTGEIEGISIRSIKNKGDRLRVGYDVINYQSK